MNKKISAQNAFLHAKRLNFKNVPENFIKSIIKSGFWSYQYALCLEFTNVPDIITKAFFTRYLHYIYFDQFVCFSYDSRKIFLYAVKFDKRFIL